MPKPKTANEPSPAELRFSLPAEWEKHEATWLGWPHNATDWPGKLDTIRWVYGEIVRKIARAERVRLLVNGKTDEKLARNYLSRAGADLKRVDMVVHQTNRGWTRDSGPIFVKKFKAQSSTFKVQTFRGGGEGETAIVHFHFNAWAKYDDWQRDRKVPQ